MVFAAIGWRIFGSCVQGCHDDCLTGFRLVAPNVGGGVSVPRLFSPFCPFLSERRLPGLPRNPLLLSVVCFGGFWFPLFGSFLLFVLSPGSPRKCTENCFRRPFALPMISEESSSSGICFVFGRRRIR